MEGIKKHLGFHVARHTLATTVRLLNGVPMETVSKLLGHIKLSTTKRCSRVIEQKISKDIGALKKVLEVETMSGVSNNYGYYMFVKRQCSLLLY
ncbi:MAG: tyrosine-type recombinase/integrase [Allomuricauda sp.]